MKIITILIAGILSINALNGQDTVMVSKADILNKLSDQNLQIKIADQTYQAAQADYRQSNALFLPSISISHTAMVTTNPLMAFGAKLNQKILTPADFDPALLNDPRSIDNYATNIEVFQPIINIDGLYERNAAKEAMQARQLQAERTKEYVELEVSKAYMQLQLAYSALTIIDKAATNADANLTLVNNYYNQGMLQKADLLDVQMRVNQIANQQQYAKSNVKNASDYLRFMLNEDNADLVYKPDKEIVIQVESETFNPLLSEGRKDIMAMDKASKASERMLHSKKMNFLPRLNAFGNYQINDDKLFGTNAKGYLIGAQLSWTLFDGYKSIGKMEKSKADYEKTQTEMEQYKSQSQMELSKAYRQLTDAENKVTYSKLALEQSQESYRIRNDRFKQGLEKTTDLLMSETQVFQKELEHLQAIFEYNFTKDYLAFLTR